MEKALGGSLSSLADQLKLELKDLLANNSTPATVSSGCRAALAETLDRVRDGSLWASRMLDSSAKLPAGLLEGTFSELGNFDGCLAARAPGNVARGAIRGQYCTVSLRPHLVARPRLHTACQALPALSAAEAPTGQRNSSSPSGMSLFRWMSQNSQQFYYAGLRLGLCVPHKCSRADLQLLLGAFAAKFHLQGQVKSCQMSNLAAANGTKLDQLAQEFDSSQRAIM